MTEIGRTGDITVGPCFGSDESSKARFDRKDYLVSHDEVGAGTIPPVSCSSFAKVTLELGRWQGVVGNLTLQVLRKRSHVEHRQLPNGDTLSGMFLIGRLFSPSGVVGRNICNLCRHNRLSTIVEK